MLAVWKSFWYFPLIAVAAVFASLAYFATGGSILGPILVHYVFNTCSTMLDTAFVGQPRYGNRNIFEMILVSMIAVAFLAIAATRGKLGQKVSP